ncbi:MAG: diadenylate cyclase CdaA [Tissierellia bacterium]|nr:diadenylate cyclase CdaA [Tissierellia bacterium]
MIKETVTNFLFNNLNNFRIQDVVDILVVAYLLYKLFTLIKDTRAEQLIKGILMIFLLTKLSEWLTLYTINWILTNILKVGTLAILIVFQPELRRGLEYLGRAGFSSIIYPDMHKRKKSDTVEEIVNAVASLARQQIGALIVIERKTGLNEIIETGTEINGEVTADLLINIFIPNTPLHDGAVIIKDNIIRAAACFLPLSDSMSISRELGTRHRAAVGVSEVSDSLAIIVSEETGSISIAEAGVISRHLDIKTLEQILDQIYQPPEESESILLKWRKFNEEDSGKKED